MKTKIIKKVLIAMDYDPNSQKVAEMGFSLAKTMGAEIVLLHVIKEIAYYSTPEYSPIFGFTGLEEFNMPQLIDADGLKKATTNFLDKLKRHLGDESIQTFVKEGEIAELILKTAKEVHADIIVMGSHSRKWLENILLGSVTEKVLHQTSTPLYIIPTKKPKLK
jgi:nucleotide-binding universal stress UspA family protein